MFKDLLKYTGGTIEGVIPEIKGISTDSRSIKEGDLFFALSGTQFDGHDHLEEVFKKGACAAVVHQDRIYEGPVIKVKDTLTAFGDLANALRKNSNVKVLAITGSNGKTTTKELLASILSLQKPIIATAGNFNNLIGLPLTLFRLTPDISEVVLEMGMNSFGEIARLTKIAAPNVALVNSIGKAHLEFLGNLENVAKAKGELYANLEPDAIALVNIDEELLVEEAKKFTGKKIFFGTSEKADIRLKNVENLGLNGQILTISAPDNPEIQILLKLLGYHNAKNALAAATAAWAIGRSWEEIKNGLELADSFPGRLTVYKNGQLCIIDDSYNANPSSLAAGLELLASLNDVEQKTAILGDMKELGDMAPTLHKEMGVLAGRLKIDYLALVGDLAKYIGEGAIEAGVSADKVRIFTEPQQAAAWILEQKLFNAAVLVKASRTSGLEKAVKFLMDSEK